MKVVALHEERPGRTRPALLLLGTAAVGGLLIGYANVASLRLVSGLGRRGERISRLALGCSPGSLIQRVITESAMLALFGGLAGAVIASGQGFHRDAIGPAIVNRSLVAPYLAPSAETT